jgi:flagellar biosynthesis/type III secretory pathway protein FliH
MPGGILKKEWARQGQDVHVEARRTLDTPLGGGAPLVPSALEEAPPPAPRHAAKPALHEIVQREAMSAAEQIRSDAEQMAAEIAEQAVQEATVIRERTVEEVSQMRQAAEEEIAARRAILEQQVRTELSKEYQERYVKALQALEGAAAEIHKRQAEYLVGLELPAFELVLGIARQVLGRELADAARSLPALIAQAFHLLQPQNPLAVRVSPVTFQQLTASELFAQTLAKAGVRLERIELEIDTSLADGQFRAESAGSHIDCDLPALLDELAAHLGAQAALNAGGEGAGA